MTLHPGFGALVVNGGAHFRVHAPLAREVRLLLHGGPAPGEHAMSPTADGLWDLLVPGVGAGQQYSYRLDGGDPRPDPASRFQPEGVHGPSEVVAPGGFAWSDDAWPGPVASELIVYELHVGTFSPEGTFAGVRERLPLLADLGVTAIELMPLADFPGARNWGYDGVALYAPSRAYGRPDDLRALVDRAHALGMAVILDVVYNHLGPEGAYLPQFNPNYLLDRHRTPWGLAVNLDGPGSRMVRQFIADNALHWIREYHLDGLRLDATHALLDDSTPHFLRGLALSLRAATHRPLVLHAEDHRNLNDIVRDEEPGWGLDGLWGDDFHHVVRRLVAGDCHGYYADFAGTPEELARTLRQGWLFTGEQSIHLQSPRGTDPSSVPMARAIVCLQNHDQVGNRAFGERLHHQVDDATWRAASTILMMAPMTPLLFMGQEWAASTPFRYFTDLEAELGRLVTDGRRSEFRDFPEFSAPGATGQIPDPQAPETFVASRLQWNERSAPSHAATLALYRRLIALRRAEPALQASFAPAGDAYAIDTDSLLLRRADHRSEFWILARLRGAGEIDLGRTMAHADNPAGWDVVMTTEDDGFTVHPAPLHITMAERGPAVGFTRPGAVVFRRRPAE